MNFKEIPKVELHLHLDGSIRLNTLNEFYQKNVEKEVIAPNKCLDLADYLTKFTLPVQYLQTEGAIEKSCFELSEDLYEDGVIYAEVRFAPLKLVSPIQNLDDVILHAIKGFQKGKIKIGIILCMMRNDRVEDNKKIIKLAEKYLNKGVVAIDLAGDEVAYPTSSFQELFFLAKEKQIPFTIHAGEVGTKESITSALYLNPNRLGHGIQAIKYSDLLETIKKQRILLEICPTSNVQTNAVLDYKSHPILNLKKAGILCSINTDNRTVSNITLTEEYKLLKENFSFTKEDFCKMNLDAIEYAFISEKEKEKYKKIILDYLKRP